MSSYNLLLMKTTLFYRTCTPLKDSIENKLDIANFFENIAGNIAGVVQYNKDNSPHAVVTIDKVRTNAHQSFQLCNMLLFVF